MEELTEKEKELNEEIERLHRIIDKLMFHFCGCGNCKKRNNACSSILPDNQAFCEGYEIEENEEVTLDCYAK